VSYKRLFSKALAAAPGRLHFAAHSHHLWPDASFAGHIEAWDDAARLADLKWDRIFGEVIPEAQRHIAAELSLPDPATIAFAPNTHDFVVRIVSALPMVTATAGDLLTLAQTGDFDLIFASQVQFNSGRALPDMAALAALARPEGPWVVIDGYHGFTATPTDLSGIASNAFYLAGGYKYAMAGEGVCFLHAPPGYAPRPEITGWYAAFDALTAQQGEVGYAPDGRRFLGSTFDPSGLYRFNAVQRMLAAERLGTEAIAAHCDALKARFLAADPLPGLRLLSDPRARFLAFAGSAAPGLHAALEARQVITDLRGEVLRIGFALYQDAEDVDALIQQLAGLRT
jgi:selenocysteine lyase/cysteine desulfurase